MQLFNSVLGATGDLLIDLWLYMTLGFLVAGAVEEFVSKETLLGYFGTNGPLAILRGVLAGFVVSACACGTIPLVASLRDRGASTATSLALLLASPWLGIPMLLLYVSFLGWTATLGLVGLSLTVAFLTGLLLARLERKGDIATGARYPLQEDRQLALAGGGLLPPTSPALMTGSPSSSEPAAVEGCSPAGSEQACTTDHCRPEKTSEEPSSWTHRLFVRTPRHAWRIARDIGGYLALGVLLAAIAKASLTPEAIVAYLGDPAGWWAPFTAFPLSVVIEACSEGFAIVAGQLHQMGASLSVVFVITMVGVATDYTELSVLWGKFGAWTTGVYLTLGTTMTLVASLALQTLL